MIRDLILNFGISEFDVTENIKWNSFNYKFNGDDRITFNLIGIGFFRIILNTNAKVNNIDIQKLINNEGIELLT